MIIDAGRIVSEGEAPRRKTVRGVVEGASVWWKLPGRQAWITSEYLYDLATGQAEADDPFEFMHDLVFTRPPERRAQQ